MLGDEFRSSFFDEDSLEVPFHFIGANGLSDSEEIGTLWDNIALKDPEKDVLTALRLILPQLERIAIIDNKNSGRNDRIRAPMGKVQNVETPTPLRTLGEGMNRLLAIALSLVNSANGLFLVDEIESGLHWSVQAAIWKLIFDFASRLKIQVFATTHSKDCIESFLDAASENTDADGIIIRLERRGDQINAVKFKTDELAIASEHGIEIR